MDAETRACSLLKALIGMAIAWVAVDTATIEAAVGWPKWLLVPAFVAYGLGFLVAALRS